MFIQSWFACVFVWWSLHKKPELTARIIFDSRVVITAKPDGTIYWYGLSEDVPLNVREGMWFQHDGDPLHFSTQMRNWLNKTVFRTQGSHVGFRSSGLHVLLIWPHLAFPYGDTTKKSLCYERTRLWWPDQSHADICSRHISGRDGAFILARLTIWKNLTFVVQWYSIHRNTQTRSDKMHL
jgi:hypothetical protein